MDGDGEIKRGVRYIVVWLSWTSKPAETEPASTRVSSAICLQRSTERYRWDLAGRRRRLGRSEAVHVTNSDVSYISSQTTKARTVDSRYDAASGVRKDGQFGGREATMEAP